MSVSSSITVVTVTITVSIIAVAVVIVGHCDVEWFWYSDQCVWRPYKAVPAPDLWYHLVAFEQQISQGSTASC